MSFVPNSTIQIFKGIPLKNKYEDTFYFPSRSVQNNYFTNLQPVSILNNQYRVEPTKNCIVIEKPYKDLYTCNYLRFINTSYENRWFYAFITNVEYSNENATRVYYEIDVMQTWLPNEDYLLGECFVEREHSATDKIGDNIVAENLATGEYISNETKQFSFTREREDVSNYQAVIVLLSLGTEETFNSVMYDNIVSSCKAYIFWTHVESDMDALRELINMIYTEHKEDRLLSVYMIPGELVNLDYIDTENHCFYNKSIGNNFDIYSFQIDTSTTLDGYTPKNNKCYTYPYHYELARTSDGESFTKRYEFCNRDDGDRYQSVYTCYSNILQPVQIVLRNIEYKTDADKLVLTNFPVCAWTSDTYIAWLNNEMPKQIIGMMPTVGVGLASAASQNYLGAFGATVSLVTQIGSLMYEGEIRSRNNIQTHGTVKSAGADYAIRRYGFLFHRYSVTKEYAKSIDDFFTMFGYATKKVKVPNIHARQNWTFTKTSNCQLKDEKLPVQDANKIESIFNNGIRFWNTSATMYDYDQSNNCLVN